MKKTMLLVMDMTNDLVHPEGPGAQTYAVQCERREVYANLQSALAKARDAGAQVGFVRIGFSPDYRECPANSLVFSRARDAGMFKLGEWGSEVYEKFAPRDREFDIVKHRVSPFYATSMEAILRAQGIDRLVLCGVSTNGVVSAGAREGHDRDFECIVLEDCCCGATEDEHNFAIEGLKRFATVVPVADFAF